MSEMAPGVYVTDLVSPGRAFMLNLEVLLPGGPLRGVAVNPADWARIPPAERERILDDVTRADAERGLARIEAMLADERVAGEEAA